MENSEALKAEIRTERGKGAVGRIRRAGKLPGVVYGNKTEGINLTVDPKDLLERLRGDYGLNAIFKLDIDGSDSSPVVRVSEYQRDPVKRKLTHVDFAVLDPEKKLTVKVPLKLVGKPVGVASGGSLRQIRRELKISARPGDIPMAIELDVSDIKIADVARVNTIVAPEGVEVIFEDNYGVATVFLPKGAAETVEEEEEGE